MTMTGPMLGDAVQERPIEERPFQERSGEERPGELGRALRRTLGETDEIGRVRLAASPDTPPEVLEILAADSAVTVRAAVALNAAASPEVHGRLCTDDDGRIRTLLATRLARLLPTLSGPERERLRVQAIGTLETLVCDEADRVRAAIADAIKDMPEAPRELVLRLARDATIAVADPVLRLSPLLTEEDLLGLLASPASPATATAIARRPTLQAAVCDMIAAGSDADAITALLENASAAIREATLDALIDRAAQHRAWHEPLVRRPSLSPRAARALSDLVATQLLGVLAARSDLPPDLARELQERVAERLPGRGAVISAADLTLDQAMAEARVLYEEEQLTERVLVETIARGETALATAMLAVAADLSSEVVVRALALRSAKGLASIAWKGGFSMRVALLAQSQLAQIAPGSLLRPASNGGFPIAHKELEWQLDFLRRAGG